MNDAEKAEYICPICSSMVLAIVTYFLPTCPSCNAPMLEASRWDIIRRRITDAWGILRGKKYALKFPGDHLFPVGMVHNNVQTEGSNGAYVD